MAHLRKKNPEDLTGVELFVQKQIDALAAWAPSKTSFAMELQGKGPNAAALAAGRARADAGSKATDARLAAIEKSLALLAKAAGVGSRDKDAGKATSEQRTKRRLRFRDT